MNGAVRTAVLVAGALFCALLAVVTLSAMVTEGFDDLRTLILGGISLVIVGMILIGLVGAILHPPRD